jgi:hypothetical protein
MSDKEILYKAIKKAEKNGYKNSDFHYPMCREQSDNILKYYWASPIIFSHDFAKAIFGEEKRVCRVCDGLHSVTDPLTDEKYTCVCNKDGFIIKETWKDHLQQMVLEKEPLKYLEKFL